MGDEAFLAALENCSLAKENFNHASHVRAGYLYLQKLPFGEAIDTIRRTIQRYADHVGATGLYHETITVAFMALINERMAQHTEVDTWEDFAARHRELFDKTCLAQFYSKETLQSDLARHVFVLPSDRQKTATQ